jgi:hypothetical protein
MDRIFFEQLELPQPDHNLDVGSGNHGEQTGRILADLEAVADGRAARCGPWCRETHQHGDGRGPGGLEAAHQGGPCGGGALKLRLQHARGDQ